MPMPALPKVRGRRNRIRSRIQEQQARSDLVRIVRLAVHVRAEAAGDRAGAVLAVLDGQREAAVCAVKMPPSCQPPRTPSTTGFQFAPNFFLAPNGIS